MGLTQWVDHELPDEPVTVVKDHGFVCSGVRDLKAVAWWPIPNYMLYPFIVLPIRKNDVSAVGESRKRSGAFEHHRLVCFEISPYFQQNVRVVQDGEPA